MLKELMIVNISVLLFITAGQSQNVTSVYTQYIKGVVNEFASAGARSFTMEDARRYPAAAFAPEHMARSGAVKKNKQPGLLPFINYRKKI
jgi:hypothetical protein